MSRPSHTISQVYDYLVDEEDARVCRDIPESACTNVPANFFRQIAAFVATKFGDEIINPKTTLTWLLTAAGAPASFSAWVVPIRESGSLLPQLAIAAVIRRMAIRKWVWVCGAIGQAVSLVMIAWSAASLSGSRAGWAVLCGLVFFSLSRGFCSVAAKDIKGKTIPKTRRGRLSGFASSIAGGLTLVAALLLTLIDTRSADSLAAAVAAAALLWIIAAVIFASVDEEPGATDGGSNAFGEALSKMSLLKTDPPFRRFVIVRTMMLCSALSAPFIVLLAQSNGGSNGAGQLSAFVGASGIASLVASPFWGRLADLSSRKTMIFACLGSAVVAAAASAISITGLTQGWIYVALFFLLMVIHSGARLGRKTYLVDLARGNRRTDYVAVSNTLIGIALLLTGSITAVASAFSAEYALWLLAAGGGLGAWLAVRLPEVQ